MFRTEFSNKVSAAQAQEISTKMSQLLADWLIELHIHNRILADLLDKEIKLDLNINSLKEIQDRIDLFDDTYKKLRQFIISKFNDYKDKLYVNDIAADITNRLSTFFIKNKDSSIVQFLQRNYYASITHHAENFFEDEIFLPAFSTILAFLMNLGLDHTKAKSFSHKIFKLNFRNNNAAIDKFRDDNKHAFNLANRDWDFIFDFVKASQFERSKNNLMKHLIEFHHRLNQQSDLPSLLSILNNINAKPDHGLFGIEKLLSTQLIEFVIPKNVKSLLNNPMSYSNILLNKRDLVRKISELTEEISLFRSENSVEIRLNKSPSKPILNKIKQSLFQAQYFYKTTNIDTTFHHGKQGFQNVDNLFASLDNSMISDIRKIEIVAEFLGRHEMRYLGDYFDKLFGYRGLRPESYDTFFLQFLFNTAFPCGLLGDYRYKNFVKEPEPTSENRIEKNIKHAGTINKLVAGDQKFSDSNDRNIIRRGAKLILFQIAEKLQKSESELTHLSSQLSAYKSPRNIT